MKLTAKWISSLEKIFPDEKLTASEKCSASALQGECFNIQLAMYLDEGLRDEIEISLDTQLSQYIKYYDVKCVPVMLPDYPFSDNDYLRKTPGLYPDLLTPCNGLTTIVNRQWRSLWFEINIPSDYPAGKYPVNVTLTHTAHKECTVSTIFELEVISAQLPQQSLIHTEWFHNDCLATYYNVPIFSERHWEIIKSYMSQAVAHGVNMILTPIFTPPLDTAVGGERPTVQLIDVTETNHGYIFGFDRLKRYVDTALTCGIKYFEFSHLFTQWGAKAAPKIIAEKDGIMQQIFGWDTPATGDKYISFLNAFIPQLKEFIKSIGIFDSCYFHISDEPHIEHLESYREVREAVATLLSDCKIIDALSNLQFYETGLISTPIPKNECVEAFIEAGVEERWTYYCCGQVVKVSNRMIAMPSYRNRIIGLQMFKFQINGFLHWGFNFWYNCLSRKLINPFITTDAGDAYPSGDPFLVYPGEDGNPLASIRQKVFFDGLQDMRALELLATLTSFEETVAFLDNQCEMTLTFAEYPRDSDRLFEIRQTINQKIKSLL